MRKIAAFVTILLFFISIYGFSQNRSIVFVDKPWAEVIEMAKSQKKADLPGCLHQLVRTV